MTDFFNSHIKSVEKTINEAYSADLTQEKALLETTLSAFSAKLQVFVLADLDTPGLVFFVANRPEILSTEVQNGPHHYIHPLTGVARVYFEEGLRQLTTQGYDIEESPALALPLDRTFQFQVKPDVRQAALNQAAVVARRILETI